MGLFKSIGRKIGRGIECIGDFLGSDTISRFGRNIQDKCAERVGSEKSYEKENANIYSTDRLNDILVSFSDGYYKQATANENAIIKMVESFYDSLLQMLESVPEISYNKANINALKRGKSRIGQTISGGIKDPLSKRMSLDDSECLRILKMDSGSEKTRAMSAFSQRLITEALENLSKKVRNSMNEQLEDIEDYLRNIAEEREREFSKLKMQLEKMNVTGKLETGLREQHCVESLLIIDAVDIINTIL